MFCVGGPYEKEVYDKLPDTYVIFICDFAPFDSQLYRYSVRNMVRETKEPLNDGSQTIILSTKGENKSEVPMMQKGQERINQLNILLSKQNRSEDIIKAASDKEYQEKLLKEFNL